MNRFARLGLPRNMANYAFTMEVGGYRVTAYRLHVYDGLPIEMDFTYNELRILIPKEREALWKGLV